MDSTSETLQSCLTQSDPANNTVRKQAPIQACRTYSVSVAEREIDPKDMYAMILYQVGALKAMLDAEEVDLSHIKARGELFFFFF